MDMETLKLAATLLGAGGIGGGVVKLLDIFSTRETTKASAKAIEAEVTDRLTRLGFDLTDKWQNRANDLDVELAKLRVDMTEQADRHDRTRREQAVEMFETQVERDKWRGEAESLRADSQRLQAKIDKLEAHVAELSAELARMRSNPLIQEAGL